MTAHLVSLGHLSSTFTSVVTEVLLILSSQLLGRVYGDPTSPTGKQPNADADIAASLRELASTPNLLPKLFYIQLSDVERMDPPLSSTHPFWNATQLPH